MNFSSTFADLKDIELLAITNRKITGTNEEWIQKANTLLSKYPNVSLLIREPELPTQELIEKAAKLGREFPDRILVHNRMDIVLSLRAQNINVGLHLSENGIPVEEARRFLSTNVIVGASKHSIEGVIEAFEKGANYVTLSPVYPVEGKGTALGPDKALQAITQICAAQPAVKPEQIFLLGGINIPRALELAKSGAKSIAGIRIFWQGDEKAARGPLFDELPT